MNLTTIVDEMNKAYELYIKQTMQAVEIRLSMNISKNPHLIISVNRYVNHPLIRKILTYPLIISKCM